ncbi:DUF4190 domain-containing protein [Cryobacterium sp. CG_9.6]|uniref:DUF4190 domain-containing protein n=1 Tax=Cryobacterium sp. CG_9.6 TaxID=2760710 RepID=UPI002474847E|nr:DUF4190 domain-containing protein [Cryobacterium sp. CG_9.6]MDH6237976.1 F0F1-type ATP synthase membrane subunit c/vacuolar-type H+-ATPase subunit K [Cryobacterium sp. CG_9.6]
MSDPTNSVPPANPLGSPAAPVSAQPVPGYAPPRPVSGQPAGPGPDTFNVLAIVSFVSAFVVSLAAIICGHIALSQIKKTGEKGRGLAIAGLVLGYVGLIGGIIAGIILTLSFLALASNPEMRPPGL